MHLARALLLLAPVALASRTAAAEPCAPRAALAGDAEAVARVAIELHRLGVVTEPSRDPRCPGVAVEIERDPGGGITVAVRDPQQRSEGRVVSDAALAAAWIDSWLIDDALAPDPVAAVSPPALAPPLHRDVVAAAPRGSLLDRISVAVGYEPSWASDGTWWSGIGGGACVHVGRLCIGARARYAAQSTPMMSRTDTSALVTASWPFEVARMRISPELGIGVVAATGQFSTCPPPAPPCDPSIGPCPCSPPVAHDFASRWSLGVRVAIPLFSRVWLDGSVGGTATSYPARMPVDPPPAPLQPWGAINIAIGLRVGAP